MSILNCPVCQGAMHEVNKQGVLIDTCTQCRGVWLDRGELEKLASMVGDFNQPHPRSGFLGTGPMPMTAAPPPRAYRHDDDDDDDDDRRYRRESEHYGKHKKSKMARLMDFFD